MIVNVWRGVPFYAISLLAGLQTISPELHEAAAIDGARAWQRFRHVTWPLLLPTAAFFRQSFSGLLVEVASTHIFLCCRFIAVPRRLTGPLLMGKRRPA